MTDPRTVRHDLLERIAEIENVFIPLQDGCRLAARVFLPAQARERPVPAVLEYIPYRKRDFMRGRDEPMHRYFAGHGYAAVRVDVRGTGDSDGVLHDEYTSEELDDGAQVIAWIAGQSWCDGNVGMMGISWGGFNALQVAALQPPALRAIITVCSTDDRYRDDAHYMGGCLLNENLQWGAMLMTYAALPPDPEIVGDRWRDLWLMRLRNLRAFPELWMRHPWRDAYWEHGSVCEDYDGIRVPVYAIGGWADAYSNAVPRLLEHLSCPRKGLVGPWAHQYPHLARPGPAIGFLQEALRWWDHWLAGSDNGIMEEPMYRVWMQQSVRPEPQYDERPGRWVAESQWPSPRIANRRWFLNPARLDPEPLPSVRLSLASPQVTGMTSGDWCGFGADGEMPIDQRQDDGRSLVFDTEPLEAPLEILGAPEVRLAVQADRATAMVAVRLNDVAPDGASTRVTYGLLNLTHRNGHAAPEPLEPGARYDVRVRLNDVAHSFPTGHRLRVAVSTSYWPVAWPAPEPVTLMLASGESTLTLPVRTPDAADARLRAFDPVEVAPGSQHKPIRPLPLKRVIERDLPKDEVVYTLSSDGGEFDGHSVALLDAIDMEIGFRMTRRHRISTKDPSTAASEIVQHVRLTRGDWSVQVDSIARLGAAPDRFEFDAEVRAREGNALVETRQWNVEIPRRLG